MQYIPCNSALFAQETLFLTQKALFLSEDFKKCVNCNKSYYRHKIAYVKIFVRIQTFGRRPFMPSHNFCHPAHMIGACVFRQSSCFQTELQEYKNTTICPMNLNFGKKRVDKPEGASKKEEQKDPL